MLSRLFDFVKPYKWRAAAGFSLALLMTVVGLIRPFLTKPMLNNGLGLAPGRTADYDTLLFYVGILVALTLLGVAGQAMRMRLMAVLGARIARDIRHKTYEHLHKLSLSFFSRKPTGSLISRITSDSERIWDFVAFTIVEAVIALVTTMASGREGVGRKNVARTHMDAMTQ